MPFSPQLNPIENVFSMIKEKFKRERLQALQTGARKSLNELVASALENLNNSKAKSIAEAGLKRWTSSDYKWTQVNSQLSFKLQLNAQINFKHTTCLVNTVSISHANGGGHV